MQITPKAGSLFHAYSHPAGIFDITNVTVSGEDLDWWLRNRWKMMSGSPPLCPLAPLADLPKACT
jgi:hypothetical protein